jgi:hypothetical protein
MAAINFNTSDAPAPDGEFAPIPAGEYPMRVVASEMKQTNDGQGQYLKLEMEITDGPSAGRKHWENLNLVNRNQQAVDIAQRSLAQLCLAVGKASITDSDELHMLPFIGKLKVTPARGEYGPGNQIAAYKSAGGNGAAPAATASQKGPWGSDTQANGAAKKKPWEK